MNQIDLNNFVQSFIQACPFGADKCKIYNLERDGYQGLHVYFRANNHAFTIEFQFWTRVDALLNQYLRDTIYTKYDNYPEVVVYASHLREWLDNVPPLPHGPSIKSYVDYLYEKAFLDDLEESDQNV